MMRSVPATVGFAVLVGLVATARAGETVLVPEGDASWRYRVLELPAYRSNDLPIWEVTGERGVSVGVGARPSARVLGSPWLVSPRSASSATW